VLDESTALALAQPTPELGRLAFYACGCMLFVAWNLGTLAGALAGGAIADPAALGLDAAFPASLVALLAPLLRRREMRTAAIAGAAVALAATPFMAPGLPILLAAAGAVAARFAREDRS
jgi:predicted branched-subunit amino acid permease